MKFSKCLILPLLVLCFSSLSLARDIDLVYKNNQGVKQFNKEKPLEAYEEFLGLTADAPYDPLLLFNLGASLTGIGEEEKAEPLYKQLLKSIDQRIKAAKEKEELGELYRIKFAVLYNLGVHYQSIKEIDKALGAYQAALEIIPESKEIKTNIEMMFSQGGGKGGGESDDKQKGEQDPKDGKGEQEQKQPDPNADRTNKDPNKKEFDQSQMSMEDLKRIMEELKQQEQKIREKMQKKGDKNGTNEKEW